MPSRRIAPAVVLVVLGLVPATMASASTPSAPTGPVGLLALGDSITQGFASNGLPWDHPENSWSTGSTKKVNSIAARLQQQGRQVSRVNGAASGAASSDLAAQARAKVSGTTTLVTVLIGANDICGAKAISSAPSADTYEKNVVGALDAVKARNPNAVVMLVSVPSMKALYDAGRRYATVRWRWQVENICPVMLASPLDTSPAAVQRRSAVEARVGDYNARLKSLAGKRANVFYDNGAVNRTSITLWDLSIFDRFHPSIYGQAKIAESVWGQMQKQNVFAHVGQFAYAA